MTRKNFIGLYALWVALDQYRELTDPDTALSSIEPDLRVRNATEKARQELSAALCEGEPTAENFERVRASFDVSLEEIAAVYGRVKAALRQE